MLLAMIEWLDSVAEDDLPVRQAPSWRLRRRPAPRPDGQQRWERAYRHLLQWTHPSAPTQPAPGQEDSQEEGASQDGRLVGARLEPAPDQRPITSQPIEQRLDRLRARVAQDAAPATACLVLRDD
jgi:hypothetical protein